MFCHKFPVAYGEKESREAINLGVSLPFVVEMMEKS
jgi:hypothetical protein